MWHEVMSDAKTYDKFSLQTKLAPFAFIDAT